MESSKQTFRLYIPYGVKKENEIAQGFGKKQLIQAALGILISFVLAVAGYIITREMAAAAFIILLGTAGAVIFTRKDASTNLSAIDHIRIQKNFLHSQRSYPYKYQFEWETQDSRRNKK
jgi:hypothetical protein